MSIPTKIISPCYPHPVRSPVRRQLPGKFGLFILQATPEEKKMRTEDVSKVLNDVQDMKGRQDEMTMKLDQIKR